MNLRIWLAVIILVQASINVLLVSLIYSIRHHYVRKEVSQPDKEKGV